MFERYLLVLSLFGAFTLANFITHNTISLLTLEAIILLHDDYSFLLKQIYSGFSHYFISFMKAFAPSS